MQVTSHEENPIRPSLPFQHHMTINWQHFISSQTGPITAAKLSDRASIVGRVGLMMLACGTGAWRVREAMNTIARSLKLTCSADIGLISIEYTCFDHQHSYGQTLTLSNSGVNTDKLAVMESFVSHFEQTCLTLTSHEIHQKLDAINAKSGNYTALTAGFASALACSAFVFLLGGGIFEMICSFVGAGIGNWTRKKMGEHHLTTLAGIAASVAVACVSYLIVLKVLKLSFNIVAAHEAGYIGAMLFVIPGFPFITSGLDMAKLDLRSGLERLTYALMIIIVATLVGWLVALLVHLKPENFIPLSLSPILLLGLRLCASFCGVYGFSIMFNSPRKMAVAAGLIGAVANTLRLELVDLTTIPAGAAAFLGALTAGLLASMFNKDEGYPRISLTVPAIVIMVPGLYMYRAIYNIGLTSISVGALWLTKAALIVMFLPLGLFTARVLTDRRWRHWD